MSFLSSTTLRRKKDNRRGIKFTLMVVGCSGLGKSTFINNLLSSNSVLPHKYQPVGSIPEEPKLISYRASSNGPSVATINPLSFSREFHPESVHLDPGIAITESDIEIHCAPDNENSSSVDNQKIMLSVIDTPGFGDNIDNQFCFDEIINYLKNQFDSVLAEETKFKRNPKFKDTRVHACLYFITPTGHGLRELDVEIMKQLARFVNVIPIVARADSFTTEELKNFKQNIMDDIHHFNIPVFQFTEEEEEEDHEEDLDDEDLEYLEQNRFLQSLQPFAIISSEKTIREYPWGSINIEDAKYSDFTTLKNVIFNTHLQDLKDLTHDYLYETYRTEKLREVASSVTTAAESATSIPKVTSSSTNKVVFPGNRDSFIPEAPSVSQLSKLASNLENPSALEEENEKDFADMLDSVEMKNADLADTAPDNASIYTTNSTYVTTNGGVTSSTRRVQLRMMSETVPYALKQQQLEQRKLKLAELEALSQKELKLKEEFLKKKELELRLKEKELESQNL